MRCRPMWWTGLALCAALITGCARVGPPTGGPEDSAPPEVEATVPVDLSTSVALDTEIRIEFNEEMSRVAVERGFSLQPVVELKNFRWDGYALVARPTIDLPDSTTFTVRIEESAADYHGVALEAPFVLMFSTGGTVDTGVISGTVSLLGEGLPEATVWACRRSVTTDGGIVRACRYSALTDIDGAFRISGVAASERPYTLLAFIDTDQDNVYTVHEESGRISETAAIIEIPGATASGIRIELSDDLEGGLPASDGEEE